MEVRLPISGDTILTIKLTEQTVVSVRHKVSQQQVAGGLTLIRNEPIQRKVFRRCFPRISTRQP